MTDGDRREGAAEALALSYVDRTVRPGVATLLELDRTLGEVLRTTSEPALGQIRLVWWRDALTALDDKPPPAMPLLEAVARDVLPHGVTGADLAELVEGWRMLLDEPAFDEASLLAVADARGGRLFMIGGKLCGAAATDPLPVAGRGWALADFALNFSDAQARRMAYELARVDLASAFSVRWGNRARGLGALARLAGFAMDDDGGGVMAARRLAQLLRFRWTGR